MILSLQNTRFTNFSICSEDQTLASAAIKYWLNLDCVNKVVRVNTNKIPNITRYVNFICKIHLNIHNFLNYTNSIHSVESLLQTHFIEPIREQALQRVSLILCTHNVWWV